MASIHRVPQPAESRASAPRPEETDGLRTRPLRGRCWLAAVVILVLALATPATCANLVPGHPTFELWPCNGDGVWAHDPTSFAISIRSPFWLQWWFLGLVALAGTAVVLALVHLHTRRLEIVALCLNLARAVYLRPTNGVGRPRTYTSRG